jgi:hypothetical protein
VSPRVEKEALVFTETRSSLSRVRLKEQLDRLQSFEPADRARAGRELVTTDLVRSAGLLLDHVANEFDDRVLTAIARAVVDTPPELKESRRVRQVREWADAELERLALEEAFLGRGPEAVDPAPLVAPVAPPVTVPEPRQHAAPEAVPVPRAPAVPREPAEPTGLRHISWRPPDDPSAADHPANGGRQRSWRR